MLEIATIMAGIVLAQLAPGPNLMAVSSLALSGSRSAGIACAAGVASGVLVWAGLFAFGVGAVLTAAPQSITIMKLLGGGYLLHLGARAIRTAFQPAVRVAGGSGERVERRQAYLRGLAVVLTNPKAALMWIAVSMYLAASHPDAVKFLVVGVCASVSALLVYGGYALLFSTGRAMRAYARFFRLMEGAFGAVFGVVGARLAIDGIRELRL